MKEVAILICCGATLKMGQTPDLVTEKGKEGLNERWNSSVMLGHDFSWLLAFSTPQQDCIYFCVLSAVARIVNK